jgi:hypothetical protein
MLPSMRPDFTVPLSVDSDKVLRALEERLARSDAPFEGQVLGDHASLRFPEGQRTMLSPYLEIEAEEEEDGGLALHGRFSPQPNVWTGFMALFGTIAMLGLAGVIYGTAQLMSGGSWLWLLAGPAAVGLIAFVHGAAFIGQGLSTREMFDLRDYVQRTVRELEADAGQSEQAGHGEVKTT